MLLLSLLHLPTAPSRCRPAGGVSPGREEHLSPVCPQAVSTGALVPYHVCVCVYMHIHVCVVGGGNKCQGIARGSLGPLVLERHDQALPWWAWLLNSIC